MSALFIERIRQDLDKLSQEYDREFAGQSRSTRDLNVLDEISRKTQDVVKRIDTIPAAAQGQDLIDLRSQALSSVELYKNERELIVRAKAAGPVDNEFAELGNAANMIFARYRRHFAGKGRATRDPGLLAEMIDDLAAVKKRMTEVLKKKSNQSMKSDLDLVSQNLEMYQREKEEIARAKKTGTLDDQGNNLASAANELFQAYRTHFAGHPRVTCRPKLLQRIITELKAVQGQMEQLRKDGLTADYNGNNIAIVINNLTLYEAELTEVKKARETTSLVDIMGNLGSAANTQFEAYRQGFAGKDRTSVNRDNLGQICDRLGEIGRQMAELARAQKNEMNDNNLQIVTQQLTAYEREWDLIGQAQGNKTS